METMGCDIHVHTEVKVDGVWHHYGAPNTTRNYALFSKMANVRNDEPGDKDYIEPIAEPRGLPDNATALTLFDNKRWNSDGHSHSWLNAGEIAALVLWLEQYAKEQRWDLNIWLWEPDNFGYLFGNTWSGFTRYPGDRLEGLKDVRWVFWFDN